MPARKRRSLGFLDKCLRGNIEKPVSKKKPPLLRARTLPAIICPSLNIIQAQLEANAVSRSAGSGESQSSSDSKGRRHFSGTSTAKTRTDQERERCYLDPEFERTKSSLGSPRASVTSVTSCASTQSTQSTGKDTITTATRQRYESTRAGLAKLAKFLTSKDKSSNNKTMHPFPSTIPNIEVTPLRRSGSVDSLLDTSVYPIDASDISSCSSMACLAPSCSTTNLSPCNLSPTGSLTVPTGDGRTIPTSPSVPAKLEAHRRGDIPSSPSVPNKLAKGTSGQRLGSTEVLLEGIPLSKAERKRLEKLNKINIDLQALFVSVEHEHLERAKSILTSTDVNVNCVNSDGFTPLDIAVMILDISMARLLQAYGARETNRFRTKESKVQQLMTLMKEAERYVDDLTSCVLSAATSGSLSMALIKEKEKQLSLWKRRQQLLWRMKAGFDKLKIPGPPTSVHLEVVGVKSLKVKFIENDSARLAETVVTKYKVEWSVRPDFHPLSGSREMMNLQKLEMVLSDLIHGVPYHVRVAAGNSKGYSEYTVATPPCAAPSSWMDVDGKKSRALGRLCQLDCLFHKIIFSRPPCSSEIKDLIFGNTLETPQQQRRQVRKSIKNLFTPTPKFQKTMKRGVYLACLIYTDHRVLVTTEDMLPVMEVDESCPSCLHNDFHWLMKVACTWEDAKALRMEMEKSQSSSAVHFRSKLLQAAEMMQTALGIQDLGQFYYRPIKDCEDTTVLCTVKYVPDAKSLNNLSLRWVPLAKIQRKLSINSENQQDVSTVNNLLLSSTQAMMAYNHVSRIPLPKGLYVAYVKISSSVDLIRILVPKKAPNVLPYYRIRENPHVSSEEWNWVKSQTSPPKSCNPTAAQLKFQRALSSAVRNLLTLLEVPIEQAGEHRIYDIEVVELNPEVSLVLLLPPVEAVCSAPGQKDDVTERTDCVLLPIQIFEMIHMSTYQNMFISRYSRVSSILEMDTIVAQHVHRQAFSKTELSSAKSRLRQLQEFQSQVDNTWRSMRWLMDVLNFAREKTPQPGGILLENILTDKADSTSSTPVQSPQHSPVLHTLQVPIEMPGLKPVESVTIRITGSSSSFSLTETNTTDTVTTEMRRCASTSGLLQAVIAESKTTESSACCTLKPIDDHSKSYSVEGLSVSFKVDPCRSDTPVSEEEEESVGRADTYQSVSEHTPSQEGIVINVLAGSSRSISSAEISNIDDVEEDDISDYKEHVIVVEDLLHDDGRVPSSEEECTQVPEVQCEIVPPEEDDETLPGEEEEDCGLQFKTISSEDQVDTVLQDDYAFCTSHLDSGELEGEPLEEDTLRISVAYSEHLPPDTSVRLQVSPEANALEIRDAVVRQVNESVLADGDGQNTEAFVGEQDLANLCLVVAFDSSERFLSGSFQPLKVQNPWSKGELLLKHKSDSPACEISD